MSSPRQIHSGALRHKTQSNLLSDYETVRSRSLELTAHLSAEDCCVQSMPDASPIKWQLGHTAWFFETFVLERWEPKFKPFNASFRVIFNSYYNAIGKKHPRPQRGLLTRPSLEEVLAYRHNIDRRMTALLLSHDGENELQSMVELGLQHEQQHQELMLTDIKHLFSCNPNLPAYHTVATEMIPNVSSGELTWYGFDEGLIEIGYRGEGFSFDNETPRHRVFLHAYQLASRLVTNREYAAFISAGGYAHPKFWLAEGWEWRINNDRQHPLYWSRSKTGWKEFTLHGLQLLQLEQAVVHVSYFETDAYARWAKARLPTEAEWENAATSTIIEGNFSDNNVFHPGCASGVGLTQLFGDAWEWTQSSYAPYPGFCASADAVGEYNGKFMVNQYVLRGGSCATPQSHIRSSYRNFFPSSATWQFSGIRLARDLE